MNALNLIRTKFCLDCDHLYEGDHCPACGSNTWIWAANWIPPTAQPTREETKAWLKSLFQKNGVEEKQNTTPLKALTLTRLHGVPIVRYIEGDRTEETEREVVKAASIEEQSFAEHAFAAI